MRFVPPHNFNFRVLALMKSICVWLVFFLLLSCDFFHFFLHNFICSLWVSSWVDGKIYFTSKLSILMYKYWINEWNTPTCISCLECGSVFFYMQSVGCLAITVCLVPRFGLCSDWLESKMNDNLCIRHSRALCDGSLRIEIVVWNAIDKTQRQRNSFFIMAIEHFSDENTN